MRTKTIRPVAIAILMFDRILMPLSSPVATEKQAATVMNRMIAKCIPDAMGTSHMMFMPALICRTPRPTETAIPNVVPMMASASMSLPGHS